MRDARDALMVLGGLCRCGDTVRRGRCRRRPAELCGGQAVTALTFPGHELADVTALAEGIAARGRWLEALVVLRGVAEREARWGP